MMDDFQAAEALLNWYPLHARDLPWRTDCTPYRVWISEIMLQQTRVEAVKPYYTRFLAALPDVRALAECDDALLMKLWEGLGYYSRARNLKKAAQTVVSEYGGVFPSRYEDIRALAGIGDYTAGAIASICFGLPEPAVDGNVLRVYARLHVDARCVDDTAVRRDVRELLRAVYQKQGACAELTQALMELGATVCIPNGTPHCGACPLREGCKAAQTDTISQYPVRRQKKARRIEEYTVYILECGERIAVRKRPQKGLLAGLWELPHLDGKRGAQAALDAAAQWDIGAKQLCSIRQKTHIFTHIEWHMACVHICCAKAPEGFTWVTKAQLQNEIALPTAFSICLPDDAAERTTL